MARVVFMGSPAFAVPSLQALYEAGHDIVAVYTQPPRPAGRGQHLQPTPVQVLADKLGLMVFHPEKLRGDALDAVMNIEADVFCVVAYGLLLPKKLVDERLCLNVHPSALPRWRGAAPLQWTLMAGDASTDVCVMKLDEGMDTGPVVARESLLVPDDWNLAQLHDVTAAKGAALLAQAVDSFRDLRTVAQIGETTHAPKITKEMRRIDWTRPAPEVHNLIRGLYPMAQAALGDEVFKVLRTEALEWSGLPGTVLAADDTGLTVACGDGSVSITELQRAGGKAAAAKDILHGWPEMKTGVVLG